MTYKVNYRGSGRGVFRDYHCEKCDWHFEKRMPYEKHEAMAAKDFVDMECPNCETCGYVRYRPAAPLVMTAAIPDGANRSEAWRDMKEASKLELEKINMPPEKRGEIQKEITNLKMTKEKRLEKENRTAKKYTGK